MWQSQAPRCGMPDRDGPMDMRGNPMSGHDEEVGW